MRPEISRPAAHRPRTAARWAGPLLLLTLPATATLAQAPAVPGGEFQVNTFTSGLQRYPSASVTPDGGFVVVWTSDVSGDGDNSYSSVQRSHRVAVPGQHLHHEPAGHVFGVGDPGRRLLQSRIRVGEHVGVDVERSVIVRSELDESGEPDSERPRIRRLFARTMEGNSHHEALSRSRRRRRLGLPPLRGRLRVG